MTAQSHLFLYAGSIYLVPTVPHMVCFNTQNNSEPKGMQFLGDIYRQWAGHVLPTPIHVKLHL